MTSATLHRARALAALLPPLLVAAGRVAATVAPGSHGRRRTGPGETFWQFRRSMPGDAASVIDWRQSARSDHLFVRETEWAAARTVWLWRDASASMDWRSDERLPTKRDRAELLILALAALLLRGGERVALLSGAQAPVSGAGALGRLAAVMARDGDAAAVPPPVPPRHATLVLVGDFLDPLDETAARIRALASGGAAGHLIQVLDPAEEALPYDGRIRFEGMEGEGDMLARRAQDLRPAYRRRLAAHRDGLAALARNAGWSLAHHRTDQPPLHALLALHARLAGGGR
ncbi:DUF58 domain-containing protein [Magnetospirillum sp. SS-4]|uniref:DUF58 domain-containing protein n=1 Tax=Magnetospirillum sp. SS-4 TaxID=2681465 RepID=UPI00138022BF|nr:DUF58 domain-containing protein [Magnetospirillum sp. SS-4]CAA7615897.1 conserved exported hypothetical protein [Magnetospirillum sp. SS-4]